MVISESYVRSHSQDLRKEGGVMPVISVTGAYKHGGDPVIATFVGSNNFSGSATLL